MLVGRAHEVSRLERLVTDARTGRSGALLIRGEPGIGKTALLEHTRALATGMTVLDARGLESAEAMRELPEDRQRSVVVAILRREMGVMALSALVIAFLALRMLVEI